MPETIVTIDGVPSVVGDSSEADGRRREITKPDYKTSTWGVGDVVEAKWRGGTHWFGATIAHVRPGRTSRCYHTYDVDYDDGATGRNMPKFLIRAPRSVGEPPKKRCKARSRRRVRPRSSPGPLRRLPKSRSATGTTSSGRGARRRRRGTRRRWRRSSRPAAREWSTTVRNPNLFLVVENSGSEDGRSKNRGKRVRFDGGREF